MTLKNIKKTKVLIFGGTGWLGSILTQDLSTLYDFETHSLGRKQCDITDPWSVKAVIDMHSPDIVINAAAKTGKPNVDTLEIQKNQPDAYEVNSIGAGNMAEACTLRGGVFFIHLSSGCIYNGESRDADGFAEGDKPNHTSYYSRTKIWAEERIIKVGTENTAIIRLRMPIDKMRNDKNLIAKLSAYDEIFRGVINSVTVIDDLVFAIASIIRERIAGTFHVVNPEPVSHEQIVGWYRQIVDSAYKCTFHPEKYFLEKGKIKHPRSNCILSTMKLQSAGIKLTPTELAVKNCLREYKKRVAR